MSIPALPEHTGTVAPGTAATVPTGKQERPLGTPLLVSWFWPIAIWLAVTVTTLVARPPMGDVDLSVYAAAWWAWIGQSDVGYLPGAAGQWTPLTLWCIELSWWLLGVSETAARLVA